MIHKNYILNKLQKHKLWLTFALSTIILCALSIFFTNSVILSKYDDSLEASTKQSDMQIVQNVSSNLYLYIQDMTSVADEISNILRTNPSTLDNYNFFLSDDIETILVASKNDTKILKSNFITDTISENFKTQEWYRSIAPGSKIYNLTSPHVQSLFKYQYPWVISLVKGVAWQNGDTIENSTILVDLNFENIQKLCSETLGEHGYIYIVSNEGDIVYHPLQQNIYAGVSDITIDNAHLLSEGNTLLKNDDKTISVSVANVRDTDWKVIGVNTLDNFWYTNDDIIGFVILISSLILGLIIIISIVLSKSITKPLTDLTDVMQKVEDGDLDITFESKSYYEVRKLSKTFNTMILTLKNLMFQIVKEQELLRKYEVNSLQEQINPHFLYNILDSVVWLAEANDSKNVVKITSSLASFFRISLSGGEDFISVEKELLHAKHYLEIQAIRFSDKYTYEINCDDSIKHLKTLKVVLQPIIENSINHGVSNLPYSGHIKLNAYVLDNNLVFEVTDNGFGIPPSKLSNILNIKPNSESGIGIQNVHKRLVLIHGEEYGLSYESDLDVGTTVKITQPIYESENL